MSNDDLTKLLKEIDDFVDFCAYEELAPSPDGAVPAEKRLDMAIRLLAKIQYEVKGFQRKANKTKKTYRVAAFRLAKGLEIMCYGKIRGSEGLWRADDWWNYALAVSQDEETSDD